MRAGTFNISISNETDTKDKQYRDFEEWFDYELQRVE
jgi:hypothetical protein